jgi:8-oxo-dGTP pyrophosphatase MutT (NUDIX family)
MFIKKQPKLPFFYRKNQPMHRQHLLSLLQQHLDNPATTDPAERSMTEATRQFVQQHVDCFERSLLIGHVTGSACIVSPDRQQTVLIHHGKLDRWFQPGGHADGDPDVAAVALKEAQEETGLTDLTLVGDPSKPPTIFDVDVHPIPARGEVPAHLHYDIRFLIEADPLEPFVQTDEVQNVRWFLLDDAKSTANSSSVSRMLLKIV